MADNYIRSHNEEWVEKRARALRGKKRTLEQKKKMSIAQKKRFKRTGPNRIFGRTASLETRMKLSEARRGHITSEETKMKISKSLKGHIGANKGGTISDEQKEKLSIAASKRVQENKGHNGRGRYGWFYFIKNKKRLFYRSHLERDWYKLLEKLSMVKSYKTEPVAIPYVWKGKIHRYIPDLLIKYMDGSLDLIEIKPEFAWNNLQNKTKWEAAKKWCQRKKRVKKFKVFGYDKLRRIS